MIDLALTVLEGKGWIDEPTDELIQTLKRHYRENPLCQTEAKYTGQTLHDAQAGRPGEILAAEFERECEEHWDESRPSDGIAHAASLSDCTHSVSATSTSTPSPTTACSTRP